MSDQLPPNPSLHHLKYQARNLQHAHTAGDEDALARVQRRLPGYAGLLSLAKAQTVVAREYGFPSWPKLKAFVEADKPRGVMPDELDDVQSAFIHAVRSEDVETVRELLGQQPQLATLRICNEAVDEDDPRSTTPLHMSSFIPGNEELVALLLEAGAEVDALGYQGFWRTPLSLAAWDGTVGCVRLLLEAGADPNPTTSIGISPLHNSVCHRSHEKTKLLLEYGAQPTLYVAVALGMVDRVHGLLEQEPGLVNVPGESNLLPMTVAAEFGQRDVAEVLIQHGAEVTLTQACGLGILDRVKTLVEKNRDAVNQVEGADAPLIAASRNGHVDIVRYLLEQGADVNLAAKEYVHDIQAINQASMAGTASADVIDLLAEAGADICHVYRGNTPLMRALGRNETAVQALVKHGGLGRFYVVGQWSGHLDRIEPLLELGADVNETDEKGRTALDHAIKNRDATEDPGNIKRFTQMIELLQKHGGRRGDSSP